MKSTQSIQVYRFDILAKKASRESRHGTHECVRHVRFKDMRSGAQLVPEDGNGRSAMGGFAWGHHEGLSGV